MNNLLIVLNHVWIYLSISVIGIKLSNTSMTQMASESIESNAGSPTDCILDVVTGTTSHIKCML